MHSTSAQRVFFTLIIFHTTRSTRTRQLTLLLSSLQCPNSNPEIAEILTSFDPRDHIQEYSDRDSVDRLLKLLNSSTRLANDEPFTNSPEHITQFSVLLDALYFNTRHWDLFYNTCVFLLDKVNSAQLFWAISVVAGEKITNVTIPSVVETFPQLFFDKRHVRNVANVTSEEKEEEDKSVESVLRYYTRDPGLNEFHTHWHIDNPFWWDEQIYGSVRDRRGELFLYMHHQIVTRYNAERLSNGLQEVAILDISEGSRINEPFYPDIININYREFPYRGPGVQITGNGNYSVKMLRDIFSKLDDGVTNGRFLTASGTPVQLLQDPSGSTILGDTLEASPVHSANYDYYGSFHNYLHRTLAFIGNYSGVGPAPPGVEAHSETSMRDPVFFRLHKLVDSLYLKLKANRTAYTKKELVVEGVSIKSVSIKTPVVESTSWARNSPPRLLLPSRPPVITTVLETHHYDISTAARPCKRITDPPVFSKVTKLNHVPFNLVITVSSSRNEDVTGMVRVFLGPEFGDDGKKLSEEEVHSRVFEIDRFTIIIHKGRETLVTRPSTSSSVTTRPTPGIKHLYNNPEYSEQRTCGFPNNLLIPKGTHEGSSYKLFVVISEEEGDYYYPNYPYCGAMRGALYPDAKPMGFPFDRPGTRFVSYEGVWAILGGYSYKNVKTIRVTIAHKGRA